MVVNSSGVLVVVVPSFICQPLVEVLGVWVAYLVHDALVVMSVALNLMHVPILTYCNDITICICVHICSKTTP